jgi:hypothetical protein
VNFQFQRRKNKLASRIQILHVEAAAKSKADRILALDGLVLQGGFSCHVAFSLAKQ